MEFINSLGEREIPFALIFTKADKISGGKVQGNMQRMKNALSEQWEEMPLMIATSAETCYGKDRVLNLIEEINRQYSTQQSEQ